MKPFLALSIAATLLFASPSPAQSLDASRSASILVEKLHHIDNYTYKMGNMLIEWIELSKKKAGLCSAPLRCLKNDLREVVKEARRENLLNEVEHSGVLLLVNKLQLNEKNEMVVGEIKPSLFQKLFNKRQKKPNVPIIGGYESSSLQLRALRKANSQPEELDPEVLKLLRRSYHRKVFGLGRVTPDQYIQSKYTFAQIKKMSDLIAETMRWTDEQASAQIVIDRTGITAKKAELSTKISEYTRLTQEGSTETAELKSLEAEIESLKNEITALDTQAKIFDLRLELFEAAKKLAESPDDEDLDASVNEINDQIDELELQMGDEMIVIDIDAANLHRLAMNHLEIEIAKEQRKTNGALRGFDGNIADMLTCAYLTGEVDGESLKHILGQKEFKEIRESFLLKTGKVLWAASKMYLMMNPYTVIPTTIVTIAIGAYQKKKAVYNEMSQKTYLIR